MLLRMALVLVVAGGACRISENGDSGSTGVLDVRSSLYFMPKRWASRPPVGRSVSCALDVEVKGRRDCARCDFRHDRHMEERREVCGRAMMLVVDVVAVKQLGRGFNLLLRNGGLR
jgi:hypothetical protein